RCLSFASATPPPALHTLSLHDALPIYLSRLKVAASGLWITLATELLPYMVRFTEEMVDGAEDSGGLRDQVRDLAGVLRDMASFADRKSTRLNSSHVKISYDVFCLKKKK